MNKLIGPRYKIHREAIIRAFRKLPFQAHPTRHSRPMSLAEVETHRHTTCRYDSLCLDFAAQLSWQAFSCTKCKVYQEEFGKEQKPDD